MRHLRIGLVLLTAAGSLLAAGAGRAQDEERVYNGLKYVCTGFGLEARQDPRWNRYPVKLMFTTGTKSYIADADGKAVFEAHCDAPWLLVTLGPGRYVVTAVARGKHTSTVKIRVVEGKRTVLAIRFPQITGAVRDRRPAA